MATFASACKLGRIGDPNLCLFRLTTQDYELFFNYGFYKHASTEEHSRIKRERLRDQKGENQGQSNIKANDIESWWNILLNQL